MVHYFFVVSLGHDLATRCQSSGQNGVVMGGGLVQYFLSFPLGTIWPRDVKVGVKMGWSGPEVIFNIFSRKRVYSRVLNDLGRTLSDRCTHNENMAGVGESGMRRFFPPQNISRREIIAWGKIGPIDVKVVVKMRWSGVEVFLNIFFSLGQNLAQSMSKWWSK